MIGIGLWLRTSGSGEPPTPPAPAELIGSTGGYGGFATTVAVGAVADTEAGDTAIAFAAGSNANTLTPPSGWIEISSRDTAWQRVQVFTKSLTGALGAETWTWGGSQHHAVAIAVYRGGSLTVAVEHDGYQGPGNPTLNMDPIWDEAKCLVFGWRQSGTSDPEFDGGTVLQEVGTTSWAFDLAEYDDAATAGVTATYTTGTTNGTAISVAAGVVIEAGDPSRMRANGVTFSRYSEIVGMKILPEQITETRMENLFSAGINTLRLQPEFVDWRDADISGRAAEVSAWQAVVQTAVDDGFNVHFQLGATKGIRADVQAKDSDWAVYVDCAEAYAEMISGFSSGKVGFSIFNEPEVDAVVSNIAGVGANYTWAERSAELHSAVRSVMPYHTIIVQATNPRSVNTITDLDPDNYDTNTLYEFHAYDMGVWTHQGRDYKHMYGIPFPASNYPGGKSAAIADMTARVNADGDLDSGEKSALIAENTGHLDYIFENDNGTVGFSKEWLDNDWAAMDGWLIKNRIAPSQIYCGEFGVVSEYNYAGKFQIDFSESEAAAFLASARLPFLAAVIDLCRERGFAGTMMHQMHGDFNLGEQTNIDTFGDDLIPEIRSLIGTAPA